MAKVISFEIEYFRFLNPEGVLEQELPPFAEDTEQLLALYRNMRFARIFDTRAIALQRTGQLGTYASALGHEAIGAGIAQAMQPADILAPAYREPGTSFARSARPRDLLLYWGGDEQGMASEGFGRDFPIAVPIASQTLHAVGAAYALKYNNEPQAVVCVVGDGGTSKGDFYEAINLAGVWQLPVVFVINNNQWAISVPRASQSGAETLAQKAIAAGLPGLQVDGNDAIAVRHYLSEALEQARSGGGASVIEALTYRMSDHTTADDASRYRSQEELEAHRKEEPLIRMQAYLQSAGLWSEEQEQALQAECEQQVEGEVEAYLAIPPQAPQSMLEYLYAEMPKDLLAQQAALCEEE